MLGAKSGRLALDQRVDLSLIDQLPVCLGLGLGQRAPRRFRVEPVEDLEPALQLGHLLATLAALVRFAVLGVLQGPGGGVVLDALEI